MPIDYTTIEAAQALGISGMLVALRTPGRVKRGRARLVRS